MENHNYVLNPDTPTSYTVPSEFVIDFLQHPFTLYHLNGGLITGEILSYKKGAIWFETNFNYGPYVYLINRARETRVLLSDVEFYCLTINTPFMMLSSMEDKPGVRAHFLRALEHILVFAGCAITTITAMECNVDRQNMFAEFFLPLIKAAHSGPWEFFTFLEQQNVFPFHLDKIQDIKRHAEKTHLEREIHDCVRVFLITKLLFKKRYNFEARQWEKNFMYQLNSTASMYLVNGNNRHFCRMLT
jgi:hypothetical protein